MTRRASRENINSSLTDWFFYIPNNPGLIIISWNICSKMIGLYRSGGYNIIVGTRKCVYGQSTALQENIFVSS